MLEWMLNAYKDSQEDLKAAKKIAKASAKFAVDQALKPIVRGAKELFNDIDGTLSFGGVLSGALSGVSGSYQFGFAFDLKGNIAIQKTSAVGFSNGTPSWSAGIYGSVTNVPSVKELEGYGSQIGGSFSAYSPTGLGLSLGGESNVIDARGSEYYGATGSMGITAGPPFFSSIEGHVERGYTTNLYTFNIYDGLSAVYHWCFD